MSPQVCCPVLLQTTTARGAGAAEGRDGGSVWEIQWRLAAWVIAQNGQSGHSAKQLHLSCAQVRGYNPWLQKVGAKWHLDSDNNSVWVGRHIILHLKYSFSRNITLQNNLYYSKTSHIEHLLLACTKCLIASLQNLGQTPGDQSN